MRTIAVLLDRLVFTWNGPHSHELGPVFPWERPARTVLRTGLCSFWPCTCRWGRSPTCYLCHQLRSEHQRHTGKTPYRCFVPDLTRFGARPLRWVHPSMPRTQARTVRERPEGWTSASR